MKKFLVLILTLVVVLSFTGCVSLRLLFADGVKTMEVDGWAVSVDDEASAKDAPSVGAYDDPNAVFTTELKPSSELKQIEVLINEEYLVCIDDPSKMTALCDMFLNAAPIPYTPKTFVHDATLYFEYTDGTITPITSFLNGNLYVLNDTYYNFAFRENGENLTLHTMEVMYDLLDMANWDDAAKEKYRDTLNYFFVEKR